MTRATEFGAEINSGQDLCRVISILVFKRSLMALGTSQSRMSTMSVTVGNSTVTVTTRFLRFDCCNAQRLFPCLLTHRHHDHSEQKH